MDEFMQALLKDLIDISEQPPSNDSFPVTALIAVSVAAVACFFIFKRKG